MQRGRVRFDVRLEGQVPAGQHDRGPVVAHGARHEHDVPDGHLGGGEVAAGGHHAHAGSGDVHAVRRAPVDHLGVTRHDSDTGTRRRLRHVGHHLAQHVDRHPLLEHEGGGERDRARPHHGQVIDGPVHGQMAGGAAREAQRLHDVGVGAEGQAVTRREVHQGGVGLDRPIARLVLRGEGGEEDGIEQGGGRLAARPVGQGHDLVAEARPSAPERLDAPEDRSLPVAGHAGAVARDGIGRDVAHDGRPEGPTPACAGRWRCTEPHRASVRASWTS